MKLFKVKMNVKKSGLIDGKQWCEVAKLWKFLKGNLKDLLLQAKVHLSKLHLKNKLQLLKNLKHLKASNALSQSLYAISASLRQAV